MAFAKLRILETTDLHMRMTGFDYLRDRDVSGKGLTALAPLIEDLRAGGVATVLCDNGDFLQGSPLADHLAMEVGAGAHPLVAAMNALRYDAVAIGNHEFDYGLERLQAIVADFDAHVLCANLRTSPTENLFTPWAIVPRQVDCSDGVRREIKIGLIGFVAPQVVDWNFPQLGGRISADDIIASALTHLPSVKRAGADIIIALAHSGIGSAHNAPRMENAALPLAELADIDVVLTGHTHDLFPSDHFAGVAGTDVDAATLCNKPAVMAGAEGSHLGVVDLELSCEAAGWSVRSHQVRLLPATDGTDSPIADDIKASLAPAHLHTRETMLEPVTRLTAPMSSHFSVLGVDPSLIASAQSQIDAIRPRLAEGRYGDLPVLASVSSFVAGGHGGPDNYIDLGPGPVCRRDVAAISPFNNPICGVLRRGWQIREWLEYAACFFHWLRPELPDQPLINKRYPAYRFDWLVGLTYDFDLSQPPRFETTGEMHNPHARRVIDLRHEGQAVEDDALFVVATSVFRARSGIGQGAFASDDVIATTDTGATDILRSYMGAAAPYTPQQTPFWRLRAAAGTQAVFETSPTCAGRPPPAGVSMIGPTEAGFLRCRITF